MGKSKAKSQKLNYSLFLGFMVFLCLFSLAAGTSWSADRFVPNGDGTVTDTKTGLMWQQADDGTLRDWADAVAYCESLVLPSSGGHSDWRAPRIDELETIVNYSRYNPAIDPVFSASSYGYWSSSTCVGSPDFAWLVDFGRGVVSGYGKTDGNYVRCVRGGPFWPFDPSTDLQTPIGKPDTVLDSYWGYMWQKGDSGDTGLTWDQANAYCNYLELDGYTDWRLPEIEALVTIVNYTTYDPALSTIFDSRGSGPYSYWSSSTYVYHPASAWFVGFVSGYVTFYENPGSYYLRCVRGGPGTLVPLTLSKSGSGTGRVTSEPMGIDCGTSCPSQTANFAQLTQVTLTAQADPGSTFMGWSGGGCSGKGPCELTIGTDPVKVTAQFERQAAVPTLSHWGMIVLPLLLVGSGFWMIRRRRV